MNWNRLFSCILVVGVIVSCHNRKEQRILPANNEHNSNPPQPGDTSALIKSLEKSFSLQPTVNTGLALANLYAETKNEKTIALCNALLAKDSARELTDAVFIKGIYYANINKQEEAIQLFEECINRDWKFIEAYIEKGIIQYHDNNITEALKTFQLATKVSNTYPDGYYWTAHCFEKLGKKQEAIDNYYRALALDKDFTEAAEAIKRIDKQ